MAHLILLMGLPCSGKTFYSRLLKGTPIHMDEIRKSVTGSFKHTKNHNDLVHNVMKTSVRHYLSKGETVILDGLFLTEGARKIYIELAHSLHCDVHVYFFDTRYPLLKERLQQRNEDPTSERTMDFHFLEELSRTIDLPTIDEKIEKIFLLNENDAF